MVHNSNTGARGPLRLDWESLGKLSCWGVWRRHVSCLLIICWEPDEGCRSRLFITAFAADPGGPYRCTRALSVDTLGWLSGLSNAAWSWFDRGEVVVGI